MKRHVVLQITIPYIREFDASTTDEDIDYFFNEGSLCLSDELMNVAEAFDDSCACSGRVDVLRTATERDMCEMKIVSPQ